MAIPRGSNGVLTVPFYHQYLESISKMCRSLQQLLSLFLHSIGVPKIQREHCYNTNDYDVGANADPDCCKVSWCFWLPDDKTPRDTTEPVASRDSSCESSPLPLTDNIGCLVRIHSGPVAHICSSSKICSYISYCVLRSKA